MEVKKKKKPFSRIIRWIFMGLLLLISLLIASAFLLAKQYEEAIKKLFISELNKRLKTEISVKDIEFTFLRQFPYGTLEFKGLVAKDAISGPIKDTLLKAEVLQLHFNILDLYHKKYVIKRIDLQDAELKLRVYRDLSDNFHCWKTPEGPAAGDFSFALQKVIFRNVRMVYSNTPSRQYYSMLFKQVKGKGKFSDKLFDLNLNGDLFITQIRSGNQQYVHNKKATISLALAINQQTGKYTVEKGEVNLDNMNLSTTGNITYTDNNKHFEFHFTTDDADLSEIIRDLPSKYAESLKEYKLKGKMQLRADLKGKFGGNDLPFIDTYFKVEGGSITYAKESISLEDLAFSGSFRNFTSNSTEGREILLNEISGKLNKGSFRGHLEIKGLDQTSLMFNVKADMDVSELLRFIPDKKVKSASGDFKLRMSYKGEMKSLENISTDEFLTGKFSCELDLNSLGWELNDQPYQFSNFNGALSFNNNDVLIHKLDGTINNNSFSSQGYFRNMVPYLLSKSEDLQLNANLSSPSINLKELLTEKKSGSNSTVVLAFPERWSGEIKLDIGKLDFGHFHGERVKTNLQYSNSKLNINQLSFISSGGSFACDGSIDAKSGKFFDITAELNLDKADINQLFYQFGNFGQNFILDENLKGSITSTIQCSFRMSPQLAIDPSSIMASFETSIENGELINYRTISGLGKFIRVDDLSRIKFSSLKNTIYIKNKTVIIPEMDVISDAVNFSMSGTQTFNNDLNYHFQLLLSDILSKKARKAKKENEEFGIEMEEASGRTTLFILLTGTVDKPVFRYDSKSVKGKIVSSFLNEKRSLKQSLKKEFSRGKKEQDSLGLRENHILKQQEKGKFVVDWENSINDSLKANTKETRKERKVEKKKKEKEKSNFKVEWEDNPQK